MSKNGYQIFDLRAIESRPWGRPIVDSEGVEAALNQMQSLLADSIGAPKIPDVKWEDVGE